MKKLRMKNKILWTVLLGSLLSGGILITLHQTKTEMEQMVEIPVAFRKISSREMIQEEDIVMISIPKYVLLEGVIMSEEEIIGQYIKPYHSVVENSLFYKDAVIQKERMNDVALFTLEQGEIAVTIEADIQSSYANSILVGHQIDLYYLGQARLKSDVDKVIIHGEIVKNARVIAVKDKDGLSIEGNQELKTAMIVVALSKEDGHLVEIAKALGKVTPIISYENFNEGEESQYYDIEKMKNILFGNSLDVTIESINGDQDE